MAPNKKVKIDIDSPIEQNSDDSDDSSEVPPLVNVDMEGRSPENSDFNGIKQLLHQLFLSAHIDIGQIADLIIAQHGIGTVLKQSYNDSDDEDDMDIADDLNVFAVTSVINLSNHIATPSVQQLVCLLKQACQKDADEATKTQFNSILDTSSRLGFLVNERFMNLPAVLADQMLGSLHAEIDRMKRKDNTYDFQYYLVICKCTKPKKKKDAELSFINDEEQIIWNNSVCSFSYCVADQTDTGLTGSWESDDEEVDSQGGAIDPDRRAVDPYRRVVVFEAGKLTSIVNEIKAFVHV